MHDLDMVQICDRKFEKLNEGLVKPVMEPQLSEINDKQNESSIGSGDSQDDHVTVKEYFITPWFNICMCT